MSFQGFLSNAPQCNSHGDLSCGICDCDGGYFGRNCEFHESVLSVGDDDECRGVAGEEVCNGRGDCFAGRCSCYPRLNPEEVRIIGNLGEGV